jgi:hypothetical protein
LYQSNNPDPFSVSDDESAIEPVGDTPIEPAIEPAIDATIDATIDFSIDSTIDISKSK